MSPSTPQPTFTDRAAGALLGLACGDALGAGYEFGGALDHDPEMIGGGAFDWEPGEWTDDTQMAICIAEVTARGQVDAEAVGERFLDWFRAQPKDVGASTGAVLGTARVGADLPSAARAYFEANPEGAAGNGSLMRTAPVALATLGQAPSTVAATARAISDLTHGDPLAGDGCVLWCLGMDHAIRAGSFDGVRAGLDHLPPQRRDRWRKWLDEAEASSPAMFTGNGFVARALQAAWASIVQTPVPDDAPAGLHLQHALRTAVRIGDDTDTVGAIAGQLLGARWGASAIPFAWRRVLHGWPGYRADDLVRLAVLSASNGEPGRAGSTEPDVHDTRLRSARADERTHGTPDLDGDGLPGAPDGDDPRTGGSAMPPPEHSDETIRGRTGRGWDDWRQLIDGWKGHADGHAAVARWLTDEHGVDPWWAQAVTVGWERLTGRRQPNQMTDGTFTANRSATVTVDAGALRARLLDETRREELFPRRATELRSRPTSKNIRLGLEEGVAEIALMPREDGRVTVVVQHAKLPSAASVERWKGFWGDWFGALGEDAEQR